MQDLKHTPGPWVAENDIGAQVSAFSQDGNRIMRCTVQSENPLGDACFIAAAPNLLEKLAALEVSANTVARCYTHRPENFAAALEQLQRDAAAARAVVDCFRK